MEKRALQYSRTGHNRIDQDEVLYNEAIDKMGTVSTAGLTGSDEEPDGEMTIRIAEAARLEREAISGISDDLLNVHGIAPGAKPEGVTRMIYKNPDRFNT